MERCVVKVTDGEGDDVGSRKLKVVSSAQKVMSEGHLRVEIEVENFAPAPAARGPAAPYAADPSGVSISHAVVIVRHVVGN